MVGSTTCCEPALAACVECVPSTPSSFNSRSAPVKCSAIVSCDNCCGPERGGVSMTEAERIVAWAERQGAGEELPAKRPQGRAGHLRHEDKQAIRLAYLEGGGRITRLALAAQFNVNRDTVCGLPAGQGIRGTPAATRAGTATGGVRPPQGERSACDQRMGRLARRRGTERRLPGGEGSAPPHQSNRAGREGGRLGDHGLHWRTRRRRQARRRRVIGVRSVSAPTSSAARIGIWPLCIRTPGFRCRAPHPPH